MERSMRPERRALKFIASDVLRAGRLRHYVIYEGLSRLFVDETPRWLARAERCVGEARDSRLAITDAAETRLCA
jgi:hypothetical protein